MRCLTNQANIPKDRYDPAPDAMTLATGDAGGRLACVARCDRSARARDHAARGAAIAVRMPHVDARRYAGVLTYEDAVRHG